MIVDPRERKSAELPASVLAAIAAGNKIEAIRLLREERGIGLKESKDTVDRYLAAHPALKRKLDSQQAESLRGHLLWLAGLIALATVAYYVVSGK